MDRRVVEHFHELRGLRCLIRRDLCARTVEIWRYAKGDAGVSNDETEHRGFSTDKAQPQPRCRLSYPSTASSGFEMIWR
jgi:hypothetical protein